MKQPPVGKDRARLAQLLDSQTDSPLTVRVGRDDFGAVFFDWDDCHEVEQLLHRLSVRDLARRRAEAAH